MDRAIAKGAGGLGYRRTGLVTAGLGFQFILLDNCRQ
jgi:hypothetical protein